MKFLQKQLPYSYFNATLVLIVLNLAAFLANQVLPFTQNEMIMRPLLVVENGHWWQLVTYMYCHGDFMHILLNMVALFFFGVPVEQRMGSVEFLIFYHLVGILAGLFTLGFYYLTFQETNALLGASGAVFGVMLAFAAYAPNARIWIMGIIPLRSTTMVIVYTAFELFSQILDGNGGVAHLTHLAGFVFAFLYMLIRLGINPWTRFMHPDRYGD